MDWIYVPFDWLMSIFYRITNNYAIALILFAILVKLVLLPLSIRQQKSSVKQATLRPKERAIRKRYAGRTDQAAKLQMATELQQMYRDEKYNVAGGCLPLLIQFPIIIILYNIVQRPLTHLSGLTSAAVEGIQTRVLELVQSGTITVSGLTEGSTAVSQIQATAAVRDNLSLFSEWVNADTILPEFTLFGIDLSAVPTLTLSILVLFPLLAGAFQWLTSFVLRKLSPPPSVTDENGEKSPEAASAESTMKIMNIAMPLLTVYIAFKLPAIMSLYWVYQSILGMASQALLYKLMPMPVYDEEYYRMVEEEMNRDYVPIPPSAYAGRSLHHIDDEDEESDEDGEDDHTDDTDELTAQAQTHRAESSPRVRYDKNGNPIRSLHYIDFDEDETDGTPAPQASDASEAPSEAPSEATDGTAAEAFEPAENAEDTPKESPADGDDDRDAAQG